MRAAPPSRRSGFTLLEVILAATIAVLLLGGLYVAVDMQLRYAQVTRDRVEHSTVVRSVMNRIENDVSLVVGLSDPARYRRTPSTGGGSGNGTGGGNNNTNGTGTGTGTGTGASSDSSGGTTSGIGDAVTLPLGVMGDSETLHLFVSRFPREAYANADSLNATGVSDLRRISYWVVGGSGTPLGLARQEVLAATSDDALNNLPPGIENENQYVLAEEVRAIRFSYFDGSDWQDSWDSTALGADGVTPVGSPRAIGVEIDVVEAGADVADPNAPVRTHRHVIAVSTANGATFLTPPTTSTTTGGGTSP
jgi:prepilin-type N-terminal cleavage/methylation domain-containing protein